MAVTFNFKEEEFNRISPFYILINELLIIESNGKSLKKIHNNTASQLFFDNYKIKSPNLINLNFNSLLSITNQCIIIESLKKKKTSLRGQIVYLTGTNQLLFMGSPWFNSFEDLINYKLTIKDFAFYDSISNMQHILKTPVNTNGDLWQLLAFVNMHKEGLNTTTKKYHDIALFSTQNKVSLANVNGHDISDIKKNQQKIEQIEQKIRGALENGIAGIITHDLYGIILSLNSMVGKIYGYQDDEMVGQSISKFMLDEDKPLFESAYLKQIKSEKQAKGIFRVLNKNGNLIYTLYSIFLKEETGKEPYIIAFSVDITEKIMAEKQLKIAQKLTAQMAQSKQNFLANMSHEIRTPMNAIMGMAGQLSKTKLDNNQKFYLDIINSASENLLVIINDILDLSKIEAGKLSLEKIGFEPKKVIGRAMQVMMHKAQEKGLNFTNSFCDIKLASVLLGDPYRFNQILLNLLSNSIKFTTKGTVDITCSVIDDSANKQKIKVTVSDSGIGMDDEFAENLFEKFTQEDDSTTRNYGGTGVGMSICKELIALMDGEISVRSKKYVGTIISFIVELEKGSIEDLPKNIADISDSKILEGKKILITDDNEMNHLVAGTILQSYGAIIEKAYNGKDALEKIKTNNFDIVLMDVQMPIMDGLEATSIIRKTISKNLPVIALTAFAIKGDDDKCINAGMNDYLTKPFAQNQLVGVVAKWLGKNIAPDNIEQTKSAVQNKLYDLSKLKDIAKDNIDFLNKMVNLFVDQTPLAILDIQTAYFNQDFETVRKLAHKIKPSLDSLCVSSLKDVIREIEAEAVNYKTSIRLEELINYTNDIVSKTILQLKEELKLN